MELRCDRPRKRTCISFSYFPDDLRRSGQNFEDINRLQRPNAGLG